MFRVENGTQHTEHAFNSIVHSSFLRQGVEHEKCTSESLILLNYAGGIEEKKYHHRGYDFAEIFRAISFKD